MPSISDYQTGITLVVTMQTITTGTQNCGSMAATVQVFDTTNDTLVDTIEMNDTAIAPYAFGLNASDGGLDTLSITIPDNEGCYLVRVTYYEVGHNASAVT